ncbi:MAG: hypothetical protein JRE38_08540 [Deltaproteobacteria bacterium]|nr:hypothetical protein [Deltaproteobacteria bacterium]
MASLRPNALIALLTISAVLLIWAAPVEAESDAEGDIEGEMARQEELQRVQGEIDAELKRQEILQRSRDLSEIGRALNGSPPDDEKLEQRADPRIAPRAPVDRDLPVAIFDSEEIEVPAGTLGNSEPMVLIMRTLDADRDGHPEQVRYVDKSTGAMIRKAADRDYDGALDTWQTYAGDSLDERTLDTNNDGHIDTWEKYSAGRMTERVIDRNGNGHKDAFYTFSTGSLVEERHDRDDDGQFDLIVIYQDRLKSRGREDRSGDGQFDTWTTYAVVGGKELPAIIKRDSNGSGKVDIIETFETSSGKPVIAKREEDTNGDGTIDVTSIYRRGKLYRRELTDPALVTE